MSDVVVLLNRDSEFELEQATCQLKDICSGQTLSRPEAWVIEFNAFLNLLHVQQQWDLYYAFCNGHAKVMSYKDGRPQLIHCERTEGMIFRRWVEKLQERLSQASSKPSPPKKSPSKHLRL